jgi:uncharacterized damage-inducible protein DinB
LNLPLPSQQKQNAYLEKRMSTPSLAGDQLLAWNDATAEAWKKLATDHPALLQIPCDIYNAGTVGKLLQHIVAVELRYAERLTNSPVTDYANIPYATAGEIFATHARTVSLLKNLLADPSFDWDHDLEFMTLTAGRRRATCRTVFQHALLHGIRHYAQLATLVRPHGFSAGALDFIVTNSLAVE